MERFDMYGLIHKALRSQMSDTLEAVGRMDPLEEADTQAALARVRTLLAACRSHLKHENEFIHAALEARRPGACAQTVHDHEEHVREIAALDAQVELVAVAGGPARVAAAQALYAELSLFIAANYQHMRYEETVITQALWEAFTDAELIEVHDALVASIPPQEMAEIVRWMAPAISPFERARLLGDIQGKAPAPVFAALLDVVRPQLTAREWDKLMHAIAPLAPLAPTVGVEGHEAMPLAA